MKLLEQLDDLAREVLLHLPCEPNGHSLHELAVDFLGGRDPARLGRMREALERIAALLGPLAENQGVDDLGRADVVLYGLPRETYHFIRRLLRG